MITIIIISVLLTPYCSGDEIKNEMGEACSTYGDRKDVYRGLVGKSEGKRPLGRRRCRWEDNIKMDLQELDVGVWTVPVWLRIEIGGKHL
jgi:hypothetical protein